MTVYGYARVSTDGQSLASQEAQLHAAGCAKVYAEKISGVRSDRPELAKVLKRLDQGDLLIVTRLDRLARSTRDLLNILDAIAKAGAGFKSLHDAWADTTSAHGRLMVTILAGLAEFERELILARTSDGRARAKARGVKFGRPAALTAHQRLEALRLPKAKRRQISRDPTMSAKRRYRAFRPNGPADAKNWGAARPGTHRRIWPSRSKPPGAVGGWRHLSHDALTERCPKRWKVPVKS